MLGLFRGLGVGGAKFGFDHGEPEFESVVTQEREEFARRASVYTVHYEGISTTSDGRKYPNVKKVSLTPLTNDFFDDNDVLKDCELKGNSNDRAYAFWDQSLKRWSCEQYFQDKDWLLSENLEKVEFMDSGKVFEDMIKVKQIESKLKEYEKTVNENYEQVKSKCKDEYSTLFGESDDENFCKTTMSYIGYQ
ncbi:hypothetical protein HF1_13840 [Mycoplasma haemofelis str. Langford 1]|uniref:Uncharacterized protein n=1 Tax=Mycoplasma haemofelis (strain Langford 1) TaxID=941640 RepID=E8ZJS1_MYCHL|nr:hypothetical protein [Mycoplasma haemofelis]CBY93392.1 hypothetical protein HF1_13840 [Mycoplasma haemofelis str. Langford 1]